MIKNTDLLNQAVASAFGELGKAIDKPSPFDRKTRELIRLASVVTDRSATGARLHLNQALDAGATQEEVEAAIINCLPVTGIEPVAAALHTAREARDRRRIREEFCGVYPKRDPVCVSHYPNPVDDLAAGELLGRLADPPPEGNEGAVYVHVPFCKPICSFCPFQKTIYNAETAGRYLKDVVREMELYGKTPYVSGTAIHSIYFGGGTPSILSADQMIFLLDSLRSNYRVTEDAQISFEGSPASFTAEKMRALRAAGANRVSLGVQTFQRDTARHMQLSHSPERARQAIWDAQDAGFENVCIDLMYNLPGQTMESWLEDVRTAVALNVNHITLFSLCVVPGSDFANRLGKECPPIGTEDYEIELYVAGKRLLENLGYKQYSVWDFARPGFEDKHVKLYYTEQKDLFSHGPAAFGYANRTMYINRGDLPGYFKRIEGGDVSAFIGRKADEAEAMHGMMAKGLRMLRVDNADFMKMFGCAPKDRFADKIGELTERGLLTADDESVRLTERGVVWGNNVCKEFFSEASKQSFESRLMLAHGKKPPAAEEKRGE